MTTTLSTSSIPVDYTHISEGTRARYIEIGREISRAVEIDIGISTTTLPVDYTSISEGTRARDIEIGRDTSREVEIDI